MQQEGWVQTEEPAMGRSSDRIPWPLLSYVVWGEVGMWVQNWGQTRRGDSAGLALEPLFKNKRKTGYCMGCL